MAFAIRDGCLYCSSQSSIAPDQLLTAISLLERDNTWIQVSEPVETLVKKEATAIDEPEEIAIS